MGENQTEDGAGAGGSGAGDGRAAEGTRPGFLEPGGRVPTVAEARELCARFADRSLPAGHYNHRAHCLVGLVCVLECGGRADAALVRLRAAIPAFNVAKGGENSDSSGYHETLTRLYVEGLADFAARHAAVELTAGLLAALWADPVATFGYATTRYTSERLWSVEARRGWVAPDLPSPAE